LNTDEDQLITQKQNNPKSNSMTNEKTQYALQGEAKREK